ncbi:unnamed protein product [Polarella glacialis]|uniref:Uncharacterized protein n=1 Tax=Polarella glacialis TaxID=89957 RepID=A0A813IMS4_POLGL|nr:unnamed protein product [Polarella glacialis]
MARKGAAAKKAPAQASPKAAAVLEPAPEVADAPPSPPPSPPPAVTAASAGTGSGGKNSPVCGDSGGSPLSPALQRPAEKVVEAAEKLPRSAEKASPGGRCSLADWYESPSCQPDDYFIGDSVSQVGAYSERGTATVELRTALRGLCAEYFEHHISPLMRCLQQAQDQQFMTLQEIRASVERKADAKEVVELQQIKVLVAEEVSKRSESTGVSAMVRLQDLSSSMQRKADANNVPTLAQLKLLSARMDQKAEAEDAVSLAKVQELIAAALKESIRPVQDEALPAAAAAAQSAQLADLRELVGSLEGRMSTELAKVPVLLSQELASSTFLRLSEEKKEITGGEEAKNSSDLRKIQLVIAAAGARFDKQLKELRQQIKHLQQEGVSAENLGADFASAGASPVKSSLGAAPGGENRWPGRVLGSGPPSEAGSDAGSYTGSMAGSMAGSVVGGLAPEERAELRKIQAVVGAAGTAFSKDLREVRRHIREVKEDLLGVKEQLVRQCMLAA